MWLRSNDNYEPYIYEDNKSVDFLTGLTVGGEFLGAANDLMGNTGDPVGAPLPPNQSYASQSVNQDFQRLSYASTSGGGLGLDLDNPVILGISALTLIGVSALVVKAVKK